MKDKGRCGAPCCFCPKKFKTGLVAQGAGALAAAQAAQVDSAAQRAQASRPAAALGRTQEGCLRALDDRPGQTPQRHPRGLEQGARAGSQVINQMKAWQGSMGIAPVDGLVRPACCVYDFAIKNRSFGRALLRSKPLGRTSPRRWATVDPGHGFTPSPERQFASVHPGPNTGLRWSGMGPVRQWRPITVSTSARRCVRRGVAKSSSACSFSGIRRLLG